MAYSEVIKDFNRIREYMREFYVYGFKSREEYTKKSKRTYDDERRRMDSWLGNYMQFRQTPEGKNVFLSIDSRILHHNPLYKAWKAKSFTDGDITFHFLLMDILAGAEAPLTLNEITARLDQRLLVFQKPRMFDASTVRKKLKAYAKEGILEIEKRGKALYYMRAAETAFYAADVLDFFSEIAPCGVIGSFLLDKAGEHKELFAFKHHYITGALDSEILCLLFKAMQSKRSIRIESVNRRRNRISKKEIVPLQVRISARSGRQYLMAYHPKSDRITSFRIDNLLSVQIGEESPRFDELRQTLHRMLPHIWGVSTQSRSGQRMEQVEFTIRYEDGEQYIHDRLEREKRCGMVEKLDSHTSRFRAEVFDASELVPWIRTFLCRITDIHFSDEKLEAQFKQDIEDMYQMYDLA